MEEKGQSIDPEVKRINAIIDILRKNGNDPLTPTELAKRVKLIHPEMLKEEVAKTIDSMLNRSILRNDVGGSRDKVHINE